jgi:hypothetical protein
MGASIEAISKVAVWKNEPLQKYCCAFVKAGIDKTIGGLEYCFGPDDIPEESQLSEKDSHLAGCAATMLLKAGIIQCSDKTIPAEGIYGGRRISKRKEARRRKIQLYILTSRFLAEAYLTKNKIDFEPIQERLNFGT